MMSYLWIFVLGSLIVTGVKMQDDGVEGTENVDSPADDLAPEESTVPDEDAEKPAPEEPAPEEPAPEEPAPEEPAPEEPAPEEPAPEEPAPEEPAPEEPAEPEAEDTNPDADPAIEDAEEVTPAAEEEPAGEEEGAEAEADEADATKTEADAPAGDPEVTEEEITPEEAPGDAEEEPAQEETEGGEENADADADLTVVQEEPVDPDDAEDVHSVGFDLADAFNEDLADKAQPEDPVGTAMGGADRHSAGQGKARSAGAVSESNDSGSGTVVGVVCGITVAAVAAITGYFTYQKKKLCFKVQRGDPESAKEENGTQSDPQVLSTLLNSS
ncbi:fibrous sheath CABYR-binding protein isoform X2 [Onychostoma macrolepis]|uniref:fibrous sheath CABYR-binding protein isoform X2 n=1 Tax=Onychostoma macrolepis TaxID=369639 RepID=UPI00272B9C93|nr:fibrous sheath CABYR-binding protein isoform X2 [Onychostoma macrolepis]